MQTLLQALDSLEQLEILLALAEDANRSWTPEELGQKMASRPVELPDIRRHLLSKGLAVSDDGASLRLTEDLQLRTAVTELLQQFRENPLQIVGPLSTGALERARLVVDQAKARAFGQE